MPTIRVGLPLWFHVSAMLGPASCTNPRTAGSSVRCKQWRLQHTKHTEHMERKK